MQLRGGTGEKPQLLPQPRSPAAAPAAAPENAAARPSVPLLTARSGPFRLLLPQRRGTFFRDGKTALRAAKTAKFFLPLLSPGQPLCKNAVKNFRF